MTSPDRAASADFDHVIITRFNVRFGTSPALPDDWLVYRFAFFRDALASALARQTVRDFRWLVYFDLDTPQWLRDDAEALGAGLFTCVYVPSWSPEVVSRTVAEVSSAPYLITTRIDSDDAVATQFVADVQAQFAHQPALYVNLLCGVQVERTGELYRYDEPSNPFISYIEQRVPSEPPRTVFFSLRHVWSRHFADLLNVVGPPRWMEVIHGTNLSNGVRGLRVRPEEFEADFDLDLPFDRSITGARYRRERVRSMLDRARLWLFYPRFAREYLHARRLRRAGTQLLPRLADDVVIAPSYPEWVRRTAGPIVRRLRRLDRDVRRNRNRL